MILRAFFSVLFLFTIVVTTYATTVIVKTGDGGNYFTPASFTINPGDTVRWVWVAGHHNTSSVTVPTGAPGWYSNLDNTTGTYYYVPTVSGLYKYTCTHHSGMDGEFFVTGCSYPSKPVVTSLNGLSGCMGDTMLLITPPQLGSTYQWIDGTTTLAADTSDTLRVTHSGNYKVVVNRCGMDSVSVPLTVVIDTLPIPSFTHTGSMLTYTFTNTTNDISNHNYVWNFGDGSPSVVTINPVHTFPNIGVFNITLEAINTSTTCSDTVMEELHIPMSINALQKKYYHVYPNPATSFIDVNIDKDAVIYLTDHSGRKTDVPVKCKRDGYVLDIRSLSKGIYFLFMSSLQGVAAEKLVIE